MTMYLIKKINALIHPVFGNLQVVLIVIMITFKIKMTLVRTMQDYHNSLVALIVMVMASWINMTYVPITLA